MEHWKITIMTASRDNFAKETHYFDMKTYWVDILTFFCVVILCFFTADVLAKGAISQKYSVTYFSSQNGVEDGLVNATARSRADVRSAITALAKIVREEMLSGRTVDLANLGSFKVVSNGKRVETEKAVTAETLKTPRIQFFPKLEMRNQAKNVQHVVIRESEAGSAKPSPNPGDLPEAPDSAL